MFEGAFDIVCCWQNEVSMLKNEVNQLKQLLLTHKDCPITAMQKESQGYLSECYTHLASGGTTVHNACISPILVLLLTHTHTRLSQSLI